MWSSLHLPVLHLSALVNVGFEASDGSGSPASIQRASGTPGLTRPRTALKAELTAHSFGRGGVWSHYSLFTAAFGTKEEQKRVEETDEGARWKPDGLNG